MATNSTSEEVGACGPSCDVSTDDEENKTLEAELFKVRKEKKMLEKQARRDFLLEEINRERKEIDEMKKEDNRDKDVDTKPDVSKKKMDHNKKTKSKSKESDGKTKNRFKQKEEKTDPRERILELSKIYDMVEKFISMEEYDEDLQAELEQACPNFMRVLEAAKRDLIRPDCGIVVTGETSGGKTSLINLITEYKKLFVTSNRATTGKVCRIRNSDKMGLSLYTKDEKQIKNETADDIKTLRKLIKKYTDLNNCPKEFKDVYFVDVCLPVPLLQGNVIIVDTPGIGESDELDNILLDFLPHAVSFIFLINAHNAGGIHEKRLLLILKKIIENGDKMPCFDPKDVLFLTNKWDIVEDESSDDDDDDEDDYGDDVEKDMTRRKLTEKEKTWNLIQEKLKNGWGPISTDKIFRLSLKQVSKEGDTEYEEEFVRFENVLKETIEISQNKRLKFYFRFLVNFIQNAERGTLARMELLKRTEDEQEERYKKQREEIRKLQRECELKRTYLLEYKDEVVYKLADRLHGYISSDYGKRQILSPAGKAEIMTVSYFKLKEEIPRRFQEGIKRWCEGAEYKSIIQEACDKVEMVARDLCKRIEDIESLMTGVKLAVDIALFGIGAIGLGMGALLLAPVLIFAAIVFAVIFIPLWFFADYLVPISVRLGAIDDIFSECLSRFDLSYLRKMFDDSVGVQYTKSVSVIFIEKIPQRLAQLNEINEKLAREQSKIRRKKSSFEKLYEVIKAIAKATDDFEKKLESGILY